ncbi:MAG: BLUF domain-containing protein [Verrucomicrobiota bacterium]
MNQCRLVYKSRASSEFFDVKDLKKLAETAAKNNSRQHITGMLALSGDSFLQVLEGPIEPVNALYNRISQDKRHCQVKIISYDLIEKQLFKRWFMQALNFEELSPSHRLMFSEKYADIDRKGVLIPMNPIVAQSILLDAYYLAGHTSD